MRQLVWSEFSSDSDTLDVSLLISTRTQSILLAALDYVQHEYVWAGDFDDIDGALGKAIEEIIEEIEGGTMSCIDVADCIETDETVQGALSDKITSDLQSGGYTPNPDTTTSQNPPPSITPSAKSENLLPAALIADCENREAWAMGLARAIVKELHESSEDLFEAIEFATNTAEAYASMSELIPMVGDSVSAAFEFVDWVLETLKETYETSYNQATEDELSCMIFCHIMESCSLSIDDLVSLYEDKATITLPPTDDLAAVFTFAIETALSAGVMTVAIFHYQILRMLSWGSVAGFSAAYLKSLLETNVSASDYSYKDLCDECAEEDTPTTYWALRLDLRVSQWGTNTIVWNGAPNDGVWAGNGYEVVKGTPAVSTLNAAFGFNDLGAAYALKAYATRSVRRGSDGNGTNDTMTMIGYPNVNQGGTANATFGVGSNTLNTNDVVMGVISPTNTAFSRSMAFRARVNQATNVPPAELRVYDVVIWGLPNSGVKPPRSYWAGNTLPATPAELFPD